MWPFDEIYDAGASLVDDLGGYVSDAGGWGKRKVRGLTDDLGITVPDPSNSPEYQKLVEAANAFQANYDADRARALQSRAIDRGAIDLLGNAARGGTSDLALLEGAARGTAPSAAENFFRTASDNNARGALGLASTLGGFNPGMALRSGLSAYQDAGARSAADMAALRAQEMATSRGQFADAMGRARGMFGQQTAGAADRDARTGLGTGSLYAGAVGAPFGAQERAGAANQALWGTLLGAGAKGLASSDERGKTNIGGGGPMADEFLSALVPKSFEYRAPGPNHPDGQRLGVMAQDLPRQNVVTGPDGQKWISADVISDVLAGLGRVNQKVEAMQPGRKPKAGTVAGGEPEYAAAMDYMTAPRSDVRTLARAASGQAPDPRMQAPDDAMASPSSMQQFLAGLGLAF